MQKIQSYLYPNRIILIADLAGFTVENTIVYAKIVKIYKGVDNVIQFDIQNADQKRLNLVTSPLITNIQMNIMDISGNELPSSPYIVEPHPTIKGIGIVTIPSDDLTCIDYQSLKYSVTANDSLGNHIPLYTDSRFSALGTIEIIDSAISSNSKSTVYDRFSGEINFMGNVTNHTSAIPCKFYEAIPTEYLNFQVVVSSGFIGQIYIEATEDSTISVESWVNSPRTIIFDNTASGATTSITTIRSPSMPVKTYNYMRVSWKFPDVWQWGSQQDPSLVYGMVDTVTVTS
jgi:hypothetical protein